MGLIGWRRGEVLGLRWSEVDLPRRSLCDWPLLSTGALLRALSGHAHGTRGTCSGLPSIWATSLAVMHASGAASYRASCHPVSPIVATSVAKCGLFGKGLFGC